MRPDNQYKNVLHAGRARTGRRLTFVCVCAAAFMVFAAAGAAAQSASAAAPDVPPAAQTTEAAAPSAAAAPTAGAADAAPHTAPSVWTLPTWKFAPSISIDAVAAYRAGDYQADIINGGFAPKLTLGLGLDTGFFGLIAALSFNTDGKYAPALADTGSRTFGDIYFMMEEGGVFSTLGPVSLRGGFLRHYDEVQSPYSLFVNSLGIAAFQAELKYDDGFFKYMSRWISLNHDSTMNTDAWGATAKPNPVGKGFPERGANIKTFAFHVGEVRFGFQDATVYTGRNFDAAYFLSPIPMYFTQYILSTGGRPWATDQDDNNIVGFFVSWERPRVGSFLAQLLVDDFNLHFLFPDTTWNPWQAAFNLGGRVEAGNAGSFGIYFAGATKYTFEPSEMQTSADKVVAKQQQCAYGYTYYPDTRFDGNWLVDGFQPRAISIEDNLIGYKYGQNNIAVSVDWRGDFSNFDLGAYAEFRLAGPNSPANPWHDLLNNTLDGTHWLDDPVLEKRIMGGFTAARSWGPWTVRLGIEGGIAIDALSLRKPTVAPAPNIAPVDSGAWIYTPIAGNTQFLLNIAIGCTYRWKLR